MLPSGIADFGDPDISGYVLQTQGSAAIGPKERVKFFKLAWDAVGSEFASRHTQYEMFYAGAGFVTKGHSYRTYDWESSTSLVDRLLSSYELPRDRSPMRELTNAL
jgi:4-hydroxyphenylacetate 3-monooxygenase